MNVILLSGGSGKRLWPLSNESRSKQFIKLFKDENNNYESMIQRMVKNLRKIDKNLKLTIVTSKGQASAINNQIDGDITLSVEPSRKGTLSSIALVASYLHDIKNINEDEVVLICPVDPDVDEEYFKALKQLESIALSENSNITLMGTNPTYPSEKYGYITRETKTEISKVMSFKEKPVEKIASVLMEIGALWNLGVYACKLKYLLDVSHKYIDYDDYYDLYNKYNELDNISFEKSILEKENNMSVLTFNGKWKDLGTWNTLTESMTENVIGNGIIDKSCNNTHIINELDLPILCMGLENVVVAASPEGILVSDKHQSSYIENHVDEIGNKVMFAEKSWGSFKVIDVQDESMTILVTLNKGNKMNYHSHDKRDEVWTVISGNGRTIVDGMEQHVKAGDVISVGSGSRHTIIADTELKLIEVQIGKEINVNDKHKFKIED